MYYSAWDPHNKRYYYYASHEPCEVSLRNDYATAPFVNWTDIYVDMPASAHQAGLGEIARGVTAHPQEIHQTSPMFRDDLLIAGGIFIASFVGKKIFEMAADWIQKND